LDADVRAKASTVHAKIGRAAMQPHVIVLLSSTSSLTEAAVYAVVDPTLMYSMNSIAEAVDVVIQVCFVLNLEFSAAARSS